MINNVFHSDSICFKQAKNNVQQKVEKVTY